ncbi:MAG: hypothetical protein JNJ78_06350 [Anaerolineae bacterium]|nr:hypothetical protein [Anaerolineae bacterium]
MSLEVKWYDDEKSIIIATITRTSTWDEYHQAVEWMVSEAKKRDRRVDVIFYDNVGMPQGNPLPHLQMGSTKIIQQPNIRLTIIAGSQGYSGFTRSMLEILQKVFSRTLFKFPNVSEDRKGGLLFMRTLEDALSHIKKDRAEAPASTA